MLTIGGKPVRFVLNLLEDKPEAKKLLSYDHFKFLGRWIPWTVGLSDVKIKAVVERKFFADMDIVNSCGVNGLMKLWLYQHYIFASLGHSS